MITKAAIENKIKEAFLDPKSSKEKKQENPSTDNYLSIDNSDNEYPLNKKNSTDNNYLLKKKKKPTAKTILKMKEKYRGTKNFVKEGTPPKEKNEKVESKDISSSSKKLDKTDDMFTTKEINKKKNRNGKVGINKQSNYAFIVYAPRKVCAKCGITNHLSIDCKTVSAPISNTSPSQLLMPNLATPNLAALSAQFSAIPFMNPFLAYNMNFVMPWNMNMNVDNNTYAS